MRLAKISNDAFALRVHAFLDFYSYWRATYDSSKQKYSTVTDIELRGFENGKPTDLGELHERLSYLIIEYNEKMYSDGSFLERTAIVAHLITFQIRRLRSAHSNNYTMLVMFIYLLYAYGGIIQHFNSPWSQFTAYKLVNTIISCFCHCMNGLLMIIGATCTPWYLPCVISLNLL